MIGSTAGEQQVRSSERETMLCALDVAAGLGGRAPGGSGAGIYSALVRRYLGSQEGLLRAALEELLLAAPIIAGDRAGFGVRATLMLRQAGSVPDPVAIMSLAMADGAARALCRDLLHRTVILPLAEWLGGHDPLGRATRLNLLWTGFITARYLLPVEPLADAHVASTRAWLERVTQAIADDA